MRVIASLLSITTVILISTGCVPWESQRENDPKFPLERHVLYPLHLPGEGAQVAAGAVTGEALEQPIPFSHKVHADELQLDCQYCHVEARKSIHSGVPPVQTCMNCHSMVKTDNPEIQKIHMAYCGEPKCTIQKDEFGQPIPPENGQPIPWKKVHDLPDYVHFSHKRHIRGGLDCTECHGQIQTQGDYTVIDVDGIPVRQVEKVMVREATLQMGWCLNCHETHPSIDKNYGDQAEVRRAELKDCWTCHK